ncbi:sucrose-6-phosphate hydrolase [Peptoanaerobacter stomatis]|uniref:Sucrose-6-phosphate hydrolase n=1 Tax=Peptoanaerobacter stomatis TaxID=796937 RepID=V9HUF2_9FIRM|nr:sucrose-6-phosphate hydrolase [Peptoanaerobacter stomatis]EHL15334.1 sucrose-6-phosphate hydrolase [Peptoanaerobacter stomatis]
MKTITNKEKYRVLEKSDLQSLKDMNEEIKKSKFRQKFHIQPITGLLNDPNGFCFFHDEWHIFYQWFPFGATHGAKNWYHMTSDDLVSWKNKGLALKPDTVFDNRGVYSGSAIVYDDKLNLIYTGNHKDERDVRHPYQCVAVLEDNGKFVKKDEPIINMSQNYTEHQRDPKIMYEDNKYYIILGAQDKDLKGRALIYVSDDIYNNWKLLGELKVKGYEDFGYMWECPDLIKIEDKYVLIFSPQGLQANGYKYNNIYQNGYLMGEMNFDTLEFIPESEFEELDGGFDFYASQSANQNVYENTAVLMAWMGLPDSSYTTDDENWSGCLTLPRELSIKNGKLIQKPARNLKIIRDDVITSHISKNYLQKIKTPLEIKLEDINSKNLEINIFSDKNNSSNSGFKISFDNKKCEFTIDRGSLLNKINTNQGFTRTIKLDMLDKLDIFIDNSSIEIFINDGEYTMTSRVFPTDEECMLYIKAEDNIKLEMCRLKELMNEEFVI